MGQKTNPISNRLGIIRGWDSNWYGGNDYAAKILEDDKIRKYLNARLSKQSISKIVIERTLKLITVTIHTAKPGLIIGKGGAEVDKLKVELNKISNKEVQINIFEVKRPEVDANIIANSLARQIEGRVSYFCYESRCRGYQGSDQRTSRWRRNGTQRDDQGGKNSSAHFPCKHRLCTC